MYTLIIILLVIVSILLALVVLVQNSKGGGLASGLSASNQVMGVRKTTDVLEKLTWGFAGALLVLALLGNFVIPRNSGNANQSIIQEQIDNTAAPAAPAPVPGGATQSQPPAGNTPAQPAQ